jgi:hypothetical protein
MNTGLRLIAKKIFLIGKGVFSELLPFRGGGKFPAAGKNSPSYPYGCITFIRFKIDKGLRILNKYIII